MNHRLRQKITIVCALSVFLACPFISMVTGAKVEADSIRVVTASRSIRHPPRNVINSNEQVDIAQLLRYAIKVDRNHLRSRILEEAEQEEDNNDGDEDEDEDDEQENEEDEDQADDENEEEAEEEEDAGDDQDQDQDEENYDDEEEEEKDEEQEEEENEQDDEVEEDEDDNEEEAQDEAEDEEQEEDESEDQEPQINFLKCAAFTIEPNVVDVDSMIENGEIDEDEAAEIEKAYVTKMTSKLNTQESIVFFTYGNGANDEDRELYMININDWITASYGYDKICHAIDQDDVDKVFSKIPTFSVSSVQKYSDHTWYAGFNCKADGTGVKTQLFLDDTCTTFSPMLNEYYPFKSTTNENRATQDYSTQVASDLTKYMIQNVNNVIQNSQYCDESEFCDNVFENSVELATCGEEADEENRNMASYQLGYDVDSNIQDVCPSIQTALSIDDEDYEYSNYEIEELVSLWSNTVNGGQESDRKTRTSGTSSLWLYLAGLVVIGSIATYLILSMKNRTRKKNSSLDSDDNSDAKARKEPLVDRSSLRQSESDIVEDLSAVECHVTQKERRKSSRSSSKSKSKSRRLRGLRKKSDSKHKRPWMSFASIETRSDSKEPPSEQDRP